jgi:hypothetical protein
MVVKNDKRGSKAAKSSGDERAPFVGYVNIALTEEDRGDFEVWEADSDLQQETFVEALSDGYQFTTKFDAGNDVYMCSVSSWDRNKVDAGIIYTARSDSPRMALAKCVFVLARKLNWDLSNGYVKRGNLDAF